MENGLWRSGTIELLWKIEYYDPHLTHYSADPVPMQRDGNDIDESRRVLINNAKPGGETHCVWVA